MTCQVRRAGLTLLAAACVLMGVTAAAAANSATSRLVRLLPRAGEMPGFAPEGRIRFFATIGADTSVDPIGLKESDTANLRKDGFRAGLYQVQLGSGDDGGVAGVTELRSPAAAAAYDRFTFRIASEPGPVSGSPAEVRFLIFSVPGVPGAKGAAQILRKDKAANANVQWTEGSCLIQLGDTSSNRDPDTQALVKAADAIYRRTRSICGS